MSTHFFMSCCVLLEGACISDAVIAANASRALPADDALALDAWQEVVSKQLQVLFDNMSERREEFRNIVIAYDPKTTKSSDCTSVANVIALVGIMDMFSGGVLAFSQGRTNWVERHDG